MRMSLLYFYCAIILSQSMSSYTDSTSHFIRYLTIIPTILERKVAAQSWVFQAENFAHAWFCIMMHLTNGNVHLHKEPQKTGIDVCMQPHRNIIQSHTIHPKRYPRLELSIHLLSPLIPKSPFASPPVAQDAELGSSSPQP